MLKFRMRGGNRSTTSMRQREISQIKGERAHILSSKSDFFLREAYKTLRTNLFFSLAGDREENSHVVMVTSSLQSEGKSITTLNLCISLAQDGKKVILIDCDLRKPKLARLLSCSAPAGLSNLLLDPQLLSQAVIHRGDLALDIILSGDIPPNPSELLGSSRMEHLLDNLRQNYDYIVLDTPPVNLVTDSAILAPKTDGVAFVVRAGQTERGAIIHAVEQIEYAKAKILGFILNGVDMGQTGYGYKKYSRYGYKKYDYGYGYGYGYGEEPAAGPSAGSSEEETSAK